MTPLTCSGPHAVCLATASVSSPERQQVQRAAAGAGESSRRTAAVPPSDSGRTSFRRSPQAWNAASPGYLLAEHVRQ